MKAKDSVGIAALEHAFLSEHKESRLETPVERAESFHTKYSNKVKQTGKAAIDKTVKLEERRYRSKPLSVQDKFDYINVLTERYLHNANNPTKQDVINAHNKFLSSLRNFEHRKKAKFLSDQLSNRSLQSRNSETTLSDYTMPSIFVDRRKKKENDGESMIARLYFSLGHKHPSDAHKALVEHDKKLRAMRKSLAVGEVFQIMKCANRSNSDLISVDDYLKNLPAFSNLPDYVLADMWKLIVAEKYDKGDVLFRQGDPGAKWFVILQGSVKLFVNKGISTNGKAIVNYLTTMNTGEKFGDQALFNDLPRSTTVIADSQPTYMLTLEKVHFLKLMGKVHVYNQKNLIGTLRKFRFLQNLDNASYKIIADRMVSRTLPPDTVILKQSAFVDTVFFIISGKCAVYRKVKITANSGKTITKNVYMGCYGPNSTFNEQAAFTDRKMPSPYTVIVKEPSEIVSIVTNGEWLNLRLNFESSIFATMSDEEILYKYSICKETESFRKYQNRFITDLHKSNNSIKLALIPATTLAKLDPFDLADIKDAPEVEFVHDFPKNPFSHFNIDEQGLVRINITNKSDLTKTVFGLTGIYTDKDDVKKVIAKIPTEKVQIIVKPGKTQFLKYKFMPQAEAGDFGLVVLVDYYDSEEPAYKSVGCIDTIKIVYSDSLFDLQSISIYLLLIGVVVGLVYVIATPSGDSDSKATKKPKAKKAAPPPVKREDSQTEANMEWIPDHVAKTHNKTAAKKRK
ncbi:hypothetical protein HDV01_000604 [Terramyces sp. JEL0728]|nr:hypothetical protein HDV01_000604 [Terramyces sp. JEL0728]